MYAWFTNNHKWAYLRFICVSITIIYYENLPYFTPVKIHFSTILSVPMILFYSFWWQYFTQGCNFTLNNFLFIISQWVILFINFPPNTRILKREIQEWDLGNKGLTNFKKESVNISFVESCIYHPTSCV